MDYPIPKCRFCDKDLIRTFPSNYTEQHWLCNNHFSSSYKPIKVIHIFYEDFNNLQFNNAKITLHVGDYDFIWIVYERPRIDTLQSIDGFVYGIIHKNVFTTFSNISKKFYQNKFVSPEQMERELMSYNE